MSLRLKAFSFENTDSNCLFNTVACSVGSVCVVPSDLSGHLVTLSNLGKFPADDILKHFFPKKNPDLCVSTVQRRQFA